MEKVTHVKIERRIQKAEETLGQKFTPAQRKRLKAMMLKIAAKAPQP